MNEGTLLLLPSFPGRRNDQYQIGPSPEHGGRGDAVRLPKPSGRRNVLCDDYMPSSTVCLDFLVGNSCKVITMMMMMMMMMIMMMMMMMLMMMMIASV